MKLSKCEGDAVKQAATDHAREQHRGGTFCSACKQRLCTSAVDLVAIGGHWEQALLNYRREVGEWLLGMDHG